MVRKLEFCCALRAVSKAKGPVYNSQLWKYVEMVEECRLILESEEEFTRGKTHVVFVHNDFEARQSLRDDVAFGMDEIWLPVRRVPPQHFQTTKTGEFGELQKAVPRFYQLILFIACGRLLYQLQSL
ncbi:hypothetical protein E6O75_ATG10520 [Venturia nashicola]|uniref:Uncharacterized protein n=1 Tax=Venturia nashicola TaxID=86259 RepID=A0A4Z1P962_9PEZI|nr:hypothetical protein E6O75_ATG10520 [Venturia nashicola]